jgi:hypothetical protein
MRWFAARTLYQHGACRQASTELIGITFQALQLLRSASSCSGPETVLAAFRKAKAEGRKIRRLHLDLLNRYGQRVVTKLLRGVEAYELDERPGDAAETFSAIEIHPGHGACSRRY